MNFGRFAAVVRRDVEFIVQRPFFWVLLFLVGAMSFLYAQGDVTLQTGDTTVGGPQAYLTSEFFIAWMTCAMVFAFYSFFVAVPAGLAVIRDDELKIGELLHTTRLTPAEYIWGKFTAVVVSFMLILAAQLLMLALFNHVLPSGADPEQIGPFGLRNYLRPGIVFGLPMILFFAGGAFAIGTRWRQPVLVFVLPVAVVMIAASFLWVWSPSWLDPRVSRLLALLDPAGWRWLSETYLEVDRGAEFYNTTPIALDAGFLLNRIAYSLIGLLAVASAQRHFTATLRGGTVHRPQKSREQVLRTVGRASRIIPSPEGAVPAGQRHSVTALGMSTELVRFVPSVLLVARAELRELVTRPSLYLFGPIIIFEAFTILGTAVGVFDAPLLATSGVMAVRMMNTLTLLICALLLFYTVESMQREHSTNLAGIYYSTSVRTSALLAGKAIGTAMVAMVILLGALLAALILTWVRQFLFGSPVQFDLMPFGVVWGLVLVPTFIAWSAFVLAVFAATKSRYTTYGIGTAVLMLSVWKALTSDDLTWVTNWMVWDALRWSDMGVLVPYRAPLLWNRLMVLGFAALFIGLAVRLFGRQEFDANRIIHRLRPKVLARRAVTVLPLAVLPLAAGVPLAWQIRHGFEGQIAEEAQKDYWRKNLATWKDAPLPAVAHVELDIELDPRRRWFRVEGFYDLVNYRTIVLRQIPVTVAKFEELRWTIDGEAAEPEGRAGLMVFTPRRPLAPGDSVRLGFSYHASYPYGLSKAGGGMQNYVLPTSIWMNVGPQFVPTLGWDETIGVDEDNEHDPREYSDDFYVGETGPQFGGGGPPFTTKIRVTGPDAYIYNSVGAKVEETVRNGQRSVLFESDEPVNLFNVVGGRWAVRVGEGTAVYYHPQHTYNLEEIATTLDAARHYYSQWFYPYPWRELRINQMTNLGDGAQGFPTNTMFTEGSFLTRNDATSNLAFLFVGHEIGHQWWGNLVLAGEGPGGDVLHEGLAHFSTLLLMEKVLGQKDRIAMSRQFESNYGSDRFVDAEKPLVKTLGLGGSNQPIVYDKGGWVMWMLMQHLGRNNMLAGLRSYIETYRTNPDHPVIQDFVRVMRPFAPDPEAFDDFVQQWFFDVVVPEYRISTATRMPVATEARWKVSLTLSNLGTGQMPVEVAAVRGDRFSDDEAERARYRGTRTLVTVGAGETRQVEIISDFEPDAVVVDPDAHVLQLRRHRAVWSF